MNHKIEKIFNRCLRLIERGCSIEYCLKKYSKYREPLEEYFNTIKLFKNLKNIKPEGMDIAGSLDRIYIASGKDKDKIKTGAISPHKKISFLKPAIVFITVLVVAIFSFTGTIYASRDSLPGETLYPVKKAAENMQLFFWPESKKGGLHFKFLNNRIYEANMLLESGDNNGVELIEMLLDEIDREYLKCKEYSYFKNISEEETSAAINKIKNTYRNRYRQDSRDTGEEIDTDNKNNYSENINNEENNKKNKGSQNRKNSRN